jgi:diaminohydroxyphosphoribosylaminopyrimidine deaminase/5-amino-6-(5-phosphoribosylamino)uracil reductase
VLRDETDEIYRPFFKYMKEGVPWVTLKAAVTLDGKIATASGDSRWVSGEASRRRVHELRNRVDAILVGANTVREDDPRLTTRLPGGKGRNSVRVVLDSRLGLPLAAKVFQTKEARTIVATGVERGRRAAALARKGVEVWSLKRRAGQVDLSSLLGRLGEEGFLHVLVEGGAAVFAAFLRERLADEVYLFVAPKVVGASGLSWVGELGVTRMSEAVAASGMVVERVGGDVLVRARL